MFQGLLLWRQPQDEICHDQVKIWPFVLVLTQPLSTLFSLQYPPQNLLFIPDVRFHMASLRRSEHKFLKSSSWIFYTYFPWIKRACRPLLRRCPWGNLTLLKSRNKAHIFHQTWLLRVMTLLTPANTHIKPVSIEQLALIHKIILQNTNILHYILHRPCNLYVDVFL